MANRHNIDIDQLREAIKYDPDTGSLTWAHSAPSFYSPNIRARWDRDFSGQPALWSINASGYRSGSFRCAYLSAHHAAWAITHGEWAWIIDHIDGNRANNAITNLRLADRTSNAWNRKSQAGSCSKYLGVSRKRNRLSPKKPWIASISHNETRVFIGTFRTEEDAAKAYDAANWARAGRFAKLNFPEVQHDEDKAGDWDGFVSECRRMRERNASAA